MLICTLCPDGENEIPVGMEFDHIRLMHSDLLEEVAKQVGNTTGTGMIAGTPAQAARHMIDLLDKRNDFLEHELAGMSAMAETKQKFHEKQAHRYRAMIGFCDWLVESIDSGAVLDLAYVRDRAKKVRHAWPTEDEQEGASE